MQHRPAAAALLVTQFYRPELIGSGPFCGDIAEWLARHGVTVQVLTGRPHYPGTEVLPGYRGGERDREVEGGVQVDRLPVWIPKSGSAAQRILAEGVFLLRGLGALVSGRVRRRPLVLSLCPSILTVALGVLARQSGGRHVAVVHDIQSGLAQGLGMVGGGRLIGMMRRLETLVLNRTDGVVVLSEDMRRQLQDQGVTRPIEICPIWIDTDAIRPLPPAAGRPPTLLYSGNFGKKQGLNQVVDMAAELDRRRPEIQVVLRGHGSQAAALAEDAARRGLQNLRFDDLLPMERLNEGLAEGDIHLVPQDPAAADFAVPSKVYGIMAAGRPFVTTARPGSMLWRLQEESAAFVCVPPNNPPAFAEAVIRLADDAALRAELGARGRKFVVENYSKPKVLGDLLAPIAGIQEPQCQPRSSVIS